MPEIDGDGSRAGALRSASGGATRDFVAFNITPSNSNNDYNARPSNRAQALSAGGNRPSARGGDLVAFGWQNSHHQGDSASPDFAPTLDKSKVPAIGGSASSVRRLTPRECERLQGFPDDYTLIPWRRGMASDGPRYKALGNSMAVPVMAWIGRRIEAVENTITRSEAA
jgi:DNA (cytosine-5)-methyltransferase 1